MKVTTYVILTIMSAPFVLLAFMTLTTMAVTGKNLSEINAIKVDDDRDRQIRRVVDDMAARCVSNSQYCQRVRAQSEYYKNH